ncbi:MAG: hemophore-related protein [Mycolicibacterium cosmeticum]|nr:hemophore-related protein [Mycolicibacterium cosmeticum]
MRRLGRSVVVVGVLATLGVGTAASAVAAPDVSAIVNSTCSYDQVMAALNAQAPDVAKDIAGTPATGFIRQLVVAPPAKRRQMIASVEGIPEVQQETSLILQIAGNCARY